MPMYLRHYQHQQHHHSIKQQTVQAYALADTASIHALQKRVRGVAAVGKTTDLQPQA